MKHIHRIYTENPLQEHITIDDKPRLHHILNVMRLKLNSQIKLFNSDQEGLYQITSFNKSSISISLIKILNTNLTTYEGPNLAISICAELPKIIAMATSIGCRKIQIIKSDFSKMQAINISKLDRCIVSALEQSNRLQKPELLEPLSLQEFIKSEQGICVITPESTMSHKPSLCKWVLVGPEGGFSAQELSMIFEHTYHIKLPTFILRSEVAAVFALGYLQKS